MFSATKPLCRADSITGKLLLNNKFRNEKQRSIDLRAKLTRMEIANKSHIAAAWQHATSRSLIDEHDTALLFQDLSIIADRYQRLVSAFPEETLHAVAVKTNPLVPVLKHIQTLGAGMEAASIPEVMLAQHAGTSLDKIVFDSPAKTEAEIRQLSESMPGVRINCDSLAELSRFDKSGSSLRLGLRVNPLISSDSIGYMNVGTSESKFGEPLSNREQIISECLAHTSLDCLHVHLGSQFSDFAPTIRGIGLILELANDINRLGKKKKIRTLNIGGGFPVNYHHDQQAFEIEHYVNALRNELPRLFDGSYSLITEFGRYVHANAGWSMSRIEYVKPAGNSTNVITHLGADMFLRECYNPGDWYHEMFLLDAQGNEKSGLPVACNIAGPLCFGGDFIRRTVDLPEPSPGDWLAVQDTGANTFSLWSRHCSRQFPKVISCVGTNDIKIAKQRESIDSIIGFWS